MAYPVEAIDTAPEPTPKVAAVPSGRPIDLLKPGSPAHARVLSYLCKRIDESERKMTQFYDRWNVLERQIQAYISLPDWEQRLKDMNNKGEGAPKAVSIVIPYTYATISTVTTYHMQVFGGRNPILQVGAYKGESMAKSQNMETMLQYNCDHMNFLRWLWQYLQDSQAYGLGVFLNRWKIEKAMRTRRSSTTPINALGEPMAPVRTKSREMTVIYEGNEAVTVDPFMFFPDPRVPMSEVAKRGEYAVWRSYEGKHSLKRDEADGIFTYVDAASAKMPVSKYTGGSGNSVRSLMAGGDSIPGADVNSEITGFYQVDQGTFEIFPEELGLGESKRPEKWLFTILNKSQIVQADLYDADHGEHPISVIEPDSVGYGFGQLGLADYMAPIQDALGWLYNSHQDNVRRVLNDVLVIDPSMIVVKDLNKNMGPGGRIRLKRSAFGQDVRTAISQLPIADVTTNHLRDMEILFRIGRQISSVDENTMGLQDTGGRKTATEVRTAFEAAASRLAAQARIISAQGLSPLTRQMTLNMLQYISDEFYITVTGQDGQLNDIHTDDIVGDFSFPVHDGTLPMDRVAMLDLWKEILLIVSKDPQLRAQYSLPKIFEYVGELGGAKNIESFRVVTAPLGQVEDAAAAGNLVPTQDALSQTPGTIPMPMQRMQEALR